MGIHYRGLVHIEAVDNNEDDLDELFEIAFQELGFEETISTHKSELSLLGGVATQFELDTELKGVSPLETFLDKLSSCHGIVSVVFIERNSVFGKPVFHFSRNTNPVQGGRMMREFLDKYINQMETFRQETAPKV